MLQFKTVVFKPGNGIFTCYGAAIRKNVPVDNRSMHEKKMFDVRLYINPELTDSISAYSDVNIKHCEVFLDNFIKKCLKGKDVINLDCISDRKVIDFDLHRDDCFIPPCDCRPCPPPPPFHDPMKPCFAEDNFMQPCDENGRSIPCDKTIPPMRHDECKDPMMKHVFNYDFYHDRPEPPHCPPGDPCCPPPPPPHDYPGCHPHHGPKDIVVANPYDSICHVIPTQLHTIIDRLTPEEDKPENKCKIVSYFGNGGCAMGGSVTTNIEEISERALEDLKRLNGRSTYDDSEDIIDVKPIVKRTILSTDKFIVNMNIPNDWCFFMIPAKHYKSIANFNWYLYNDTTNTWDEDKEMRSQTTFTIQSNGVRYWVNAISLDGVYSLKFAKSGLTSTDPDDGKEDPTTPDDPSVPESVFTFIDIVDSSSLESVDVYEAVNELTDYSTETKLNATSIVKSEEGTKISGLTINKVYAVVDTTTHQPCMFFRIEKNFSDKSVLFVSTNMNKVDTYEPRECVYVTTTIS